MRASAISIRPSSSAPSIAVAGIPRRSAAASTVVRSPESSAAASRSSARTCSDAASKPRAYARSTRLEIGTGASTAPSSSPSRLSSVIASGSPWVLRKISSTRPAADTAADQSRRQQARRLAVERPDRQLLEPRGVERGQWLVTCGQDHRDRRAGEPAAREQQRVKRRRVEPMHVVDAREHRPLGRREQQQAENGRPHEEALALDGRQQAERPAQRRALRARQLAKAIQHRAQQLEHPGEGDLGLARDAAGPQHREAFVRAPRRSRAARTCPRPGRPATPARHRHLLVSRRSATPAARTPGPGPGACGERTAERERCMGRNVGSSWTRAGGARPYGHGMSNVLVSPSDLVVRAGPVRSLAAAAVALALAAGGAALALSGDDPPRPGAQERGAQRAAAVRRPGRRQGRGRPVTAARFPDALSTATLVTPQAQAAGVRLPRGQRCCGCAASYARPRFWRSD